MAREDAETKQRRLAAAFKAARNLNAVKEAELRAGLARQQALLQQQEAQTQALDRELHNRDATDRIFGAGPGDLRGMKASRPGQPSSSPQGPHNAMPPLPGKKLSEHAQPFQER